MFFSEGILFVHPHHGSITLSMSHINTIKLCDGVSNALIHNIFGVKMISLKESIVLFNKDVFI